MTVSNATEIEEDMKIHHVVKIDNYSEFSFSIQYKNITRSQLAYLLYTHEVFMKN